MWFFPSKAQLMVRNRNLACADNSITLFQPNQLFYTLKNTTSQPDLVKVRSSNCYCILLRIFRGILHDVFGGAFHAMFLFTDAYDFLNRDLGGTPRGS